ncbi:NitT/TauT family transport system permease protein/taurine transport system permease protein [Rhizobiales bacterium GAS188]|nr:NitT/TauT family transport system permease protein/taurine transport system permease protein [Rhizobiales bacterium GAS188]
MTIPAPSPALAPAAPRTLPSRSLANRNWAISIASVVLGVIVWQVAALVIDDKVLLPTPVTTAAVLMRYLQAPYPANGETLIGHALVSLGRVLGGFVIGSVVGIGIGALMAGFRGFRAMVDPFIEITRPLPPLAFVPVLIVWFGIGEAPKIILIAAGVVPVMAISTAAGLAGVPDEMLNAARCLGASEWYTMLHVRIRAAVPQIITGMRLSVGLSWTSIVAVEMIAATSGLGFVILQAGQFLNTGLIFAGILVIAVLGLGIDAGLRRLQRHLDPTMRP